MDLRPRHFRLRESAPEGRPHVRSGALGLHLPDGRWEISIHSFNLCLRAKDKKDAVVLSTDGSEGDSYALTSIHWSSDSKYVAALRVCPGYPREVH
jgi:hypothetical protein